MSTKITEDQIVKVLRDPQYKSERQRSLALWPTPSGSHITKFREIRKKYGIPEPEAPIKGRPATREIPKSREAVLRFDDIRKDDRLMRGPKRLIVLSVDNEGILFRRMDGSEYRVTRKQFELTAQEYTKVPLGDPQGSPVKVYTDPSFKISAGDVKVNGQPIKNLPDAVKEKIVEKLIEEVPISTSSAKELAGRKPATSNPKFEAAVQDMIAMNETREDPVKVPEPDYIDPAYSFDRQPEPAEKIIRGYLADIDQLLDILIRDCAEPEMAEQTKKLICYKLVIGFQREIGQEVGA